MTEQNTPRKPRENGNGKQKCQNCPRKAIAGMVKGKGLCPYHWAVAQWGQTWADSIYLPE